MNYNKKSVRDIELAGKKVLLRCDFNVPLKAGVITSDKRIVAAVPTIKYLLEQGCAVIACSHLGKPEPSFDKWAKKQAEKGKAPEELTEAKWQKALDALKMEPVAKRLSELLGQEVILAADVVGPDAQAKAAALKGGQIMLLQNTRFEKGETKNDPEFVKKLAALAGEGGVYVSDAFGAVHRAHASTAGVAQYLPAVSGFLIEKELGIMGKALANPDRPFVAILGGAKVSDKLNVISNLLEKVDTLIIGGGMAYTFMAAKGYSVGTSLLDSEKLDYCKEMMAKAEKNGVKLLLPVDTVVAASFPDPIDGPVAVETVASDAIPADKMGLDIGEKTREIFAKAVMEAKTVVWNGPMGVFENPTLAAGTIAVAKALADSDCISIVGGGDSAAACEQLGFADKITHISTGGGASLEFLEGKELPGVACLLDR